MSRRRAEKMIIILYIVLGAILTLSGISIMAIANIDITNYGLYIRFAVFGLGVFLLLLGVHLVVVGINSLKG